MDDAQYFMQVIASHYEEYRGKMKKLCANGSIEFDDDVFADTLLKCHDRIQKQKGLKDRTEQGCLNYFFRSFVVNIRREAMYAYRQKTSLTDEMGRYDFNETESPDGKIRKDLKEDFSIYYIMTKAQANVDDEAFHLFNLKFLGNYTYKELQRHTKAKGIRQKVASVKKWIKENITKEEVDAAFDEFMSE